MDACCAVHGNECDRDNKCGDGSACPSCIDRASSLDWLFGLWPGPPHRFEPTGYGTHYLDNYQWVYPNRWPSWGRGDLTIGWTGGAPGGSHGRCDQGGTYRGTVGEICGGHENWGATDVEVWYPLPPVTHPDPAAFRASYEYQGCFADNSDGQPRDMAGQSFELSATTDEWGAYVVDRPKTALADCARLCSGYRYMGLQWTNQCFCDNDFGSYGTGDGCGDHGQDCATGEEGRVGNDGACGGVNAVFAVDALPRDGSPMPPPSPPALPPPNPPATFTQCSDCAPFFIVTSGCTGQDCSGTPPCVVSGGGRCVGRPEGYGRYEDCAITVGGGGGALGPCPREEAVLELATALLLKEALVGVLVAEGPLPADT
eukprot:COSAG04_NODE_52_length_30862_cov_37.882005_1_plen_371_part_00